MKTQAWLTRMVCGTAVLLWTGVGFADDLTNLLRLVQAVAQDRSGTSRSDRGARERSQEEFRQPASRSGRDAWKRNQEEGWAEQSFERNSRTPSRGRGPATEGRGPASSNRDPGFERFDSRLDRNSRSDRFANRPNYDSGRGFDSRRGFEHGYGQDPGYGYDPGYGFSDSGRFPGEGWVEERHSAELSFSVGTDRLRVAYGTPRPRPIPVPVPVPVPVHQVGEIVRCRVPLATCVRVRGADHICGHFVPVIVAVRDPALCEHDVERLVYVQVLVPPVPPRKVEVSRCHTRVELCFGELDVEIVSKNGTISVEYDD